MKAPDKIYIGADEIEGINRYNNTVVVCSTNQLSKKDTVFIRKDALLEWASGELMPGNSAEGKGWNLALQTLIDKLNSM